MAYNQLNPHNHPLARPVGPPTVGISQQPMTPVAEGLIDVDFDEADTAEVRLLKARVGDSDDDPDVLIRKLHVVMLRDRQISDVVLQRWVVPELRPSNHTYRLI